MRTREQIEADLTTPDEGITALIERALRLLQDAPDLLAALAAAEARAEMLADEVERWKLLRCHDGTHVILPDSQAVKERDAAVQAVERVKARLEQLIEMHTAVTDHTGETNCLHCDTTNLPCDTHGVATLALAALSSPSTEDGA